jgi:cell division protein FtsB
MLVGIESELRMALGRELKRKAKAVLAPLLFLCVVAYFGWNATNGDRGLVAYAHRKELLKQAHSDLARAEAERATWERRVAGLRGNHLDRDTLDERSRAMLNLADPSDVIVPYEPKERLF